MKIVRPPIEMGKTSFVAPEQGTVLVFLLEHEMDIPEKTLSAEFDWTENDMARMQRFRHGPARTSFCVSRILVRRILSDMTGVPWKQLPWITNEFGKPGLSYSDLKFNWSHTAGCIACALCTYSEIGCDIESTSRHLPGFTDIVESNFSHKEAVWIGSGGNNASWNRFLSVFIQKEACLKAAGTGLSGSLSSASACLTLPDFDTTTSLIHKTKGEREYYVSVKLLPRTNEIPFDKPGIAHDQGDNYHEGNRTAWLIQPILFSAGKS